MTTNSDGYPHIDNELRAPPSLIRKLVRLRVGDNIAYTAFVATVTAPSKLPDAGSGLYAATDLTPFTWLGFYPGEISAHFDDANNLHTMGTAALCKGAVVPAFIVADAAIKEGMHMVNEAGRDQAANVWYVKLGSGYVLYFVGSAGVPAGQELCTCYSQTYGDRRYPTPDRCTDPRCLAVGHTKHRMHSTMLEEWEPLLLRQAPQSLPLPPRFYF